MNVFSKVTLESLRKNRTRTIVTLIGVILSTALICAVTTSVATFRDYIINFMKENYGEWHAAVENSDKVTLDIISSSGDVEDVTYYEHLGYAGFDTGNESCPFLYVIASGDDFEKLTSLHVIKGRYPENENEILIQEQLMYGGDSDLKIGDTITLDIGRRMRDGIELGQDNPYYSDEESESSGIPPETLEDTVERTFTICGICERPPFEDYFSPGFTAVTYSPGAGEDAKLDIFFKMKSPDKIYSFIEFNGLENTRTNSELLMALGVSRYDSFYKVLYGVTAILIVLIVFGSVSLIYNAFSISVSERTKQFGLLSSIGATKKQLRRMVYFEALCVSAVGIPLGILVGLGGIGTTLRIIGGKIAVFMDSGSPMRMKVSLAAIVIAAAIALFTVLISALIPSIRATRVTAIEAIRQSGDIKAKNVKSKTSRITYRLFGLSGVIAQKHFRRSRKRYRSTIMSLFMSIVLFISAASFTMYMKRSIEGPFGTMDYDIQFSSWAEEDEREEKYGTLNRIFSEDENVKEYVEIMRFGFDGTAERSILSDKIKKEWLSEDGKAPLRINITACFIDDVQFRKLAEENNADVSDFYKDEPACILFDGAMDFNGEKGRYETVEWFNCDSGEVTVRNYDDVEGYYYAYTDYEGDEPLAIYYSNESSDDMLTFPEDEVSSSVDIKFLARTTEKSFYINGQNTAFIFPMSAAPMLMSEGAFLNCPHQYMIVADGKPDKAMNSLSEELESAGFEKKYLYNYAEDKENERNIILIVNVFSYGFIVIISLIATANVFNTITTNMKLRRREFAMLRSVGMTMKAMKKMLVYECLMYGGKALLWGLPASAIVSYLIYKAISNGMEVSFRLPAGALIISVLSVFAVVFTTMIYSMHKIKKDNLIDALKNETA